jgi:hypothetical protein
MKVPGSSPTSGFSSSDVETSSAVVPGAIKIVLRALSWPYSAVSQKAVCRVPQDGRN